MRMIKVEWCADSNVISSNYAMNEVSENGTITADKLEGPMAGKQISDLAAAGNNGTLYVNVHTEQNPNGEIRGQGGNPTMK
jgi:CHRD domain